jgi:hypothetical protein
MRVRDCFEVVAAGMVSTPHPTLSSIEEERKSVS